MSKKNRIIVPCKLAYLNCWKPKNTFGQQFYSLVAIIPKSDMETVRLINDTIEAIKEKSVEKWGGRIPANYHSPLHDGDEEKPDNPIFRGCWYLNAKRKDPPQIVDDKVAPITDPAKLYSGCHGNVSLIFYGYNFGGNKGIGVLLGNIQKTRDGDRMSQDVLASDEFSPVTYEDVI